MRLGTLLKTALLAFFTMPVAYGQYSLERFARGLDKPVKYIVVPDSDVAWVVEQPGYVRVLINDEVQPEPALDLTARVYDARSETGLLGLTLHPDYPTDNRVFINYTAVEGRQLITRISSLRVTDGVMDARSEEVLLTYDQPYSNHNGGDILFGTDGYLYIGVGDGGSGGDPQGNGQNLMTLLGTVLRIDINVDSGYAIPEDNPFVDIDGARPEIFAYGLRNPWGMSFDQETGELWLADVGQDREEEINLIRAGGNYGWNVVEGSLCFPRPGCTLNDYDEPLYTYNRSMGASVTGGFLYRGDAHANLSGAYIFGDFESGKLFSLEQGDTDEPRVIELVETARLISAIAHDREGEVVLVDHGGRLYRLAAE